MAPCRARCLVFMAPCCVWRGAKVRAARKSHLGHSDVRPGGLPKNKKDILSGH